MKLWEGYGGGKAMPLGTYSVFLVAFNSLFGASLKTERDARGERRGASPHASVVSMQDALLTGVATHKLTRIIAKDFVTAPIRAPFTRYEESAGSGEVEERPRGEGWRRAIGDLVGCNYCLGPWVALGFLTGLRIWPERTRKAMTLFSAVAVSDFLHEAYAGMRSRRDLWDDEGRVLGKKRKLAS